MAKLTSHREVASVHLYSLEVSESEMEVYVECMNFLLRSASADQVEEISGATPDELEAMRDDLVEMLSMYQPELVEELKALEPV